jgi:probable selenium-dependent hydroxylase accessory protein YqeC
MFDPRDEGRPLDAWLQDPAWLGPEGAERPPAAPSPSAAGFLAFACPGVEGGKALGLHPSVVDAAAAAWDLVLCEADGARRLPLKAPAEHEPVIPALSPIVVALMGLDAIGRPLGEAYVYRAEHVARICGGPLGRAIDAEDLRTLAIQPDGAFKGCPRNARRFLILNKAELVDPETAQALAASIRQADPDLSVGLANLATGDEIDERER